MHALQKQKAYSSKGLKTLKYSCGPQYPFSTQQAVMSHFSSTDFLMQAQSKHRALLAAFFHTSCASPCQMLQIQCTGGSTCNIPLFG